MLFYVVGWLLLVVVDVGCALAVICRLFFVVAVIGCCVLLLVVVGRRCCLLCRLLFVVCCLVLIVDVVDTWCSLLLCVVVWCSL